MLDPGGLVQNRQPSESFVLKGLAMRNFAQMVIAHIAEIGLFFLVGGMLALGLLSVR